VNIAFIIQRCQSMINTTKSSPKKINSYIGKDFTSVKDLERVLPALFAAKAYSFRNTRIDKLISQMFQFVIDENNLLNNQQCDKTIINEIMKNELLPYYTEFHHSRSREVSFLPLELRLFVYNAMYKIQVSISGQLHVLDRIGITLTKMGQFDRAKIAYALKALHYPDTKEALSLFYIECQGLESIYQNRLDILKKRGFNGESKIDELTQAINAFTDIANFNDIRVAPAILHILEAYFPALSHDKEFIQQALYYLETGDRSGLDALQISPVHYAEEIVHKAVVNPNLKYVGSYNKKKMHKNTTQKEVVTQKENKRISDKKLKAYLLKLEPRIFEFREPSVQKQHIESSPLFNKADEPYAHLPYVDGGMLAGYIDYVQKKFILRYILNDEHSPNEFDELQLINLARYVVECLEKGQPFIFKHKQKDELSAFSNPMQIELILHDIGFVLQILNE